MTDKYAKLREAEHPGAKALARIEAALKPDPTKNVATWSEYQVATLPHNLADVLKYVAAEKARADAAEARVADLENLAMLMEAEGKAAEAAISTLTAERDALKRELDEAVRDFHEARSVRMETGKLLTKTRIRAEKAERERGEAREAILTVVSAVRSYLPPDGDDEQTFASNVIAAVDNPRINPLINEWEQENGGA